MNIQDSIAQSCRNALEALTQTTTETVGQNIQQAQNLLQSLDILEPSLHGAVSTAVPASEYGDYPVDMGAAFYETMGSLVQDVAGAVSNALDATFTDFANDGEMQVFHPSAKAVEEHAGRAEGKVYVVNGVRMDNDKRVEMGQDTADLLGSDVTLIHNSTGGDVFGLITDTYEYLAETFFAVPSPATETLSNEIYTNLTSDPPQDIQLIGYSQGSTQTADALSLAIAKMKQDGMSDEEIRQCMTDHVDVTLIGTPVDPGNLLQMDLNVPPGFAGIGQKRLDWYFTTEDRVIHGGTIGNQNANESATITSEGSDPNFVMIRHEKDIIATSVRDAGNLMDIKTVLEAFLAPELTLFDPTFSLYIGFRALTVVAQATAGALETDTHDPVGYHDYDDIYYEYMETSIYSPPAESGGAGQGSTSVAETKEDELRAKKEGRQDYT